MGRVLEEVVDFLFSLDGKGIQGRAEVRTGVRWKDLYRLGFSHLE